MLSEYLLMAYIHRPESKGAFPQDHAFLKAPVCTFRNCFRRLGSPLEQASLAPRRAPAPALDTNVHHWILTIKRTQGQYSFIQLSCTNEESGLCLL